MPRTFTASLIAAAAFALVPFAAQAQGQAKGPPPLPEGKGKELVSAVCAGCHVTGLIPASSGYTRDHWNKLVSTMIDLSGTPDQQKEILDYLTQHFPPNKNRAPTLVSGSMQVTFKEWVTPQLGARTRDPMQHPDGSIWYVGQYGNIIGRLDPATGKAQEWQLPPGSHSHTLQLDHKGNPWWTGNKNGTVGRFDPATGQSKIWKMPNPKSDPHTLAFSADNRYAFFSFQASNLIGRIDTQTDEVKVVSAPNPKSQPYDVKVDSEGTVWVSCNARGCFLKVNPVTMEVTEIPFPSGGSTRRFTFAPDGMLWYANSNRGQIGRYDPKTNQFKEWASPSGPRSHPYGVVWLDNAFWYNESGMRPDTLVRFDIATETFQSWPIPSGDVYAGIWRNGRTTRQGTILIHQTATNRIIEVIPQRRAASR